MKKAKTLLTLLTLAAYTGHAKDTKPLSPPSAKTMHFTENKGQVTNQHLTPRTDIDFKLATDKGLNIFIGKGKIEYQWAKPTDTEEEKTSYDMYRLDLELIGANKQASVITEGQQTSHERYFQPWINKGNSNKGVQAHAYNKITYKDIYPHIDWVFYFNNKGQLEHDFIVRPGGNVTDIKMKYTGADKLQHNTNGSFTATTSMGAITEKAPIAYEQKGRAVSIKFVLQEGVLSFATAAYSGTLTIDPVIEWGTYFGGTANDAGMDITTDKWGNIYLCGATNSVANIATTGAHQSVYGGAANDAFLSKWSKDGALLWATYYGGTNNIDIAKAVACDSSGNVYMGGYTNSAAGIATANSFQPTKMGTANRTDAFVAKFDSSGSRLWATYYGGTLHEGPTGSEGFGLVVDNLGNMTIAGCTQSNNLALAAGTHQLATGAGYSDGFIAQFTQDGTLSWATYYGGAGEDVVNALDVDDTGNIYVTGSTQSATGIATTGAYQPGVAGAKDAFLVKFNSAGSRQWGTYLGGNNQDVATVLLWHGTRLIVAGSTASTSGIASPTAHQPTFGGGNEDGFVQVLNADGSFVWGTYYGGQQDDFFSACYALGNNLYLAGTTFSNDNISTPGVIKDNVEAYDAFLVKLDTSGTRIWGTYIGGLDIEEQTTLTGYGNDVYVAGKTSSATGVAVAAFQQSLNGGDDAFLIKINDCPIPPMPLAIQGAIALCAGDTALYTVAPNANADTYIWSLPNGWIGSSDSNSITVTAGESDGEIKVRAVSACGGQSDTQSMSVTVWPLPSPVIVNNNNVLSTSQAYSTYQWMLDGNVINGAITATLIAVENGSYQVRVSNNNGCINTSAMSEVSGVVAVGNVSETNSWLIYPNPVTEEVWIRGSQSGTYKWITIDGKQIGEPQTLSKGANRIQCGNFAAGLYILMIHTDEGTEAFRMIKK